LDPSGKITLAEATSRLMQLCSREEKCKADCLEKLRQWGIFHEEANGIVLLLEKERFINDSRFAGIFARDKFRFNHWGKIRIRYLLQQKGVSDEIITEAIDSIDQDEYTAMIRKVLAEKTRTIKGKNEWDTRAKLLRFAQSKGFEYDLTNSILKEKE
jgi:regulatory protein